MALKPRSHARKRAPAAAPGRPGTHASPVFVVTLGLLFALPVLFTPGLLVDEFEFVKVSLLVTGALVLAAWWIAAESSRIGSAGFLGWLKHMPGRVAAAVRRDPLGGAVALFLLSAAASTIASVRPGLSLFGAPQSHAGLRTILGLVAIYYASRSLASRPTWFQRVAQAAAAAAAVAAVYSFLQIAGFDPFTLRWHRQMAFTGAFRAFGTLGHANKLSAYLTMCLPLVVWLAARSGSRAARIAWLALACLSLFVIAASLSRGAWLGVLAVTLAALLLGLASAQRVRRSWILVAFGIAAAALVLPLATPMRAGLIYRAHQLTDVSAPTSRTRLELWRAGIRMAADHPVLGVGVDAYVAAFPRYRTSTLTRIEWGGTPTKAHNDAIQILATQGLLGGLAALAMVLLTARAAWRIARRDDPGTRGAAVAAGAALVGYVAPNLVGFGSVASSALAAALAGWAARAARADEVLSTTGSAAHEGTPARSFWNLAAGVALAGALWFLLVSKPLQAEIFLAKASRSEAGSLERDESLAHAAATAPWDPRYAAELGRSLFYGALRERDPEASWYQLARARTALEQAVHVAPENGENRTLLASVMAAQASFRPRPESKDEARREFERAVALDPMNPEVLVGAERGLLAAGLVGDARRIALRCAHTYPDYAPPLADLGTIALEEGRVAAAAETLGLAVGMKWREDPRGAADAWNDLARARLALGRYPEAVDAADSALAHNPGLGQAFATKEAAKRAMSQKADGGGRGE